MINKVMEVFLECTSHIYFEFCENNNLISIYCFDIFHRFFCEFKDRNHENKQVHKTYKIKKYDANNNSVLRPKEQMLYQDSNVIGYLVTVSPKEQCASFLNNNKIIQMDFVDFCTIITNLSVCGGILTLTKNENNELIFETNFETGRCKYYRYNFHYKENFSVSTIIKYYKILLSLAKFFKKVDISYGSKSLTYDTKNENFSLIFTANHYDSDEIYSGE